AGRVDTGVQDLVCGSNIPDLADFRPRIAVGETLTRLRPSCSEILAPPHRRAEPLAPSARVQRARGRVIIQVVDRPGLAEWPAQAPVPAALVTFENERALPCPNQDQHTSTHLPVPPC